MRAVSLCDPADPADNAQAEQDTFVPLFAAVSNAHVFAPTAGTPPSKPLYGTNAQYASAQDKAVLEFFTAAGGVHRYQIPAPKVSQFFADQVTVNPAATAMAALITAILNGNFCDNAGNVLTEFVAGFYQRRKLPRRVSSLVLSPKGDTPAQ